LGIRARLAHIFGKLGIRVLRLLGRAATTAPGRVILAVDPGFISRVSGQVRHSRAVITGTNGKTTTAALLEGMMAGAGWKVVRNASGSNMAAGIATALVDHDAISGCDALVAEVDEAALAGVAAMVQPDLAVVTNFFRDQLDRYGELDRTVDLVRRGLERVRGTACLNADDPRVADLADSLPGEVDTVFFGLAGEASGGERDAVDPAAAGLDTQFCPRCGGRFTYEGRVFGHLGDYRCPDCGWRRPARHVVGRILDADGAGLLMAIDFPDGDSLVAKLGVPGAYNAYNAVGAAAAARAAGIDGPAIRAGLEAFTGAFGRMERLSLEDREVVLALSKNPVGFDQILRAVADDAGTGAVLVGINDGHADGRDISWLWDVDFEMLDAGEVPVVVSGTRAEDMAVRLKYGGLDLERLQIVGDLEGALERAVERSPRGARVYALLTYTAMLGLRERLERRGLVGEMWRG